MLESVDGNKGHDGGPTEEEGERPAASEDHALALPETPLTGPEVTVLR